MSPFHCARCGYLSAFHGPGDLCPGAKAARWQDPTPIEQVTWREVMARDAAARTRAAEAAQRPYEPVVAAPPLIAPRSPSGKTEFASYRDSQAAGLGRRAVAAGFAVEPLYWCAADGSEGCAVRGRGPQFSFVATWKRPATDRGKLAGWRADVAYAWPPLAKLTHTDLEALVN